MKDKKGKNAKLTILQGLPQNTDIIIYVVIIYYVMSVVEDFLFYKQCCSTVSDFLECNINNFR